MRLLAQDWFSLNAGITLPTISWIMKRQTRVPASTVVRMNSASNRMAKWYQIPISALPPKTPDRMLAMPTASVGAPPVRESIDSSPTSFATCVNMSGVTRKPQFDTVWRGLRGGRSDQPRGAVHGEIDAGVEYRGADHGHDGDEGFHQHRAIADEPDLIFVLDHLRRGARGDQRMPAGHRPAGDRDEQEREDAAGPDRAGAVDEFGERRHLQVGTHDDDARSPAARSRRSS